MKLTLSRISICLFLAASAAAATPLQCEDRAKLLEEARTSDALSGRLSDVDERLDAERIVLIIGAGHLTILEQLSEAGQRDGVPAVSCRRISSATSSTV